jgi:T5SS/PEP-CTERM-associated repeat protein
MKRDTAGGILRSCLLLVMSSAAAVPAVAKNWADGTGNWNVPANWSPAAVPIAGEAVNIVFTDGTARTVTYDAPSTPALSLVSIDLTGAGTGASTLLLTNSGTNNLSTGGFNVGGYNGSAATAGRGAVTQSVGTATIRAGVDMALGYGAGSTGTYTLSGGAVVANQSEFIGLNGTGTFNHSGGTNTINSGAIGAFDIGAFAGSLGTYNLSGTGQLISNKSEYVGDGGTGIFNHTGGTNTISGTNSLNLGNTASGTGTYTASGSAALNVGGDVTVGVSGSGTFNVQGNANVNITGALNIGAGDQVNLSSGKLRFNGYSRNATGVFSFTGGTVQLAGNRYLNFDSTLADIYGSNPVISNSRNLTVEGTAYVGANSAGGTATVSNASFVSQGKLTVGGTSDNGTLSITNGSIVTNADVTVADATGNSSSYPLGTVNVDSSIWNTGGAVIGKGGRATVNVINGGYVVSSYVYMGLDYTNNNDFDTILVSGPGSSWISNDYFNVGGLGTSKLTIANGGNVYVAGDLRVWLYSELNMNGGTLRFNTLDLAGLSLGYDYAGKLNYNGGTIQIGGSRNVGTDADIQYLYGFLPVVPTGKGLTIENTMTLSTALHLDGGSLKAFSLNVVTGGSLDFDGGTFELTGGSVTGLSSLSVPTGGEFRALGSHSFRVTGAADSLITATGDLTIGNASAVNGFGTQGTVNVGANMVTLLDANDVVFDSLSLVTIGNGTTTGTLSAANGLTLDFGGNIAGYGTVSTPNLLAKPLIANGHITGTSAAQKITLSGYVKGVGTFDNVTFSGTFSPGLSPTVSSVGSISLGSSSTLVMEIGGTTPGSSYDQIQASGALGLGGILQIPLINGFNPSAGQSFDLLNWGSISGTFSSISLPTLAGLTWNTSQLYTTGVISVVSAGLAGDYNGNGIVDAADYTVWRDTLGNAVAASSGADGNANGVIDQADYDVWKSNFGNHAGSGSSANAGVPEPAAIALALIAAALLYVRPRAANKSNC